MEAVTGSGAAQKSKGSQAAAAKVPGDAINLPR